MDTVIEIIPPRIPQIHRVVARIGVPVGPDPCLGHLKPVGLDEPPKLGIKVAAVQVPEA